MSFASLPIGRASSIDRAVFSRGGQYLGLVAAPNSKLQVLRSKDGKNVARMREVDVEGVGFRQERDGDFDTEVLYSTNKSNLLRRFSLNRNRALAPLALPSNARVYSIATSCNGWFVAVGQSDGTLSVFDLNRTEPKLMHGNCVSRSSIYQVAFESAQHNIVLSTGGGHMFKLDIDGNALDQIGGSSSWVCWAMSSAGKNPGVALAGDGTRVWLIDLPFALPEADEDQDLSWANGKPMDDWQRDAGTGSGKLALRQRLWCPDVDAERCAYVDADVGSEALAVCLSDDYRLMVAGETGVELYRLNEARGPSTCRVKQPSGRRIFAITDDGSDVLIALAE